MRFLLRSLLVLAVAVAFGVLLYYAVQALPGAPTQSQPEVSIQSGGTKNIPVTPTPRPDRPKNSQNRGIRWRSILGIARRVIVFSVLVILAVLGKNFVFDRKPDRKKKIG